ncbi:hypothetical protein [Halomicrobium mukohataei]|uniref:Uncharacterized protein n=1 Tax=Halomicrobium mukohataei (strain ATCC 700874 / DSM 12286 / JCM 9738 / NCIMB 13541) TaxID=485914 RepID=C7NYE9_HALMD|nr:hypothetical protein [Halomicrobium mukohataei]ACV46610.1 hypothetical protein Hmuk_0476 [Halomicrobium mukohataei DSM 12286]
MASYTRAAQSATLTDGGHDRRALALSGTANGIEDTDGGHDRRLFGLGASAHRVGSGRGIVIPTGNFRRVHVTLKDTDGQPLSDAVWVQSAGVFPTAARVDDNGEADLWLLNVLYETFVVIASSDRSGVDYVWYQLADDDDVDGTQTIGTQDREATLYFDPVKLKGLSVGRGGNLGGPLA